MFRGEGFGKISWSTERMVQEKNSQLSEPEQFENSILLHLNVVSIAMKGNTIIQGLVNSIMDALDRKPCGSPGISLWFKGSDCSWHTILWARRPNYKKILWKH